MLIKLMLSDIAVACDGELIGPDQIVSSVVTDSRKLSNGCVFVALRGDNFDGHDYAALAMESGAVGVVSSRDIKVTSYVKVADTRLAYGCIAHLIRDAFTGPIICITGSNGKTTVKDWLAQSFSEKNVLKTRANLNNQIGLPQTLLELNRHHDIAVVEAGTSVSGEIERLAKIAVPDVVVLTNASGSHFEGIGDLEDIAREKGCLISGSALDATIVLNADDAFFDYWCGLAGTTRRVLSFGFNESADLYAYDFVLGAESSTANMRYKDECIAVEIAGAGRHMIANGMAVVLAAIAVGVSFSSAVKKIGVAVVVAGRLERLQAKHGALLINDCYNASPTSVEAAIDVLAMQQVEKTWLILGALGELGEQRDNIHRALGSYASKHDISCLICVGSVAGVAGAAFKEYGGRAEFCETHEEAAAIVASLNKSNAILVKGSRSAKMEKIIEILRK